MTGYFSDRENGPRARTEPVISPTVWVGLVGTVQALINSGAFGLRFPERCPDGQAICGCDSTAFAASLIAEMPRVCRTLVGNRSTYARHLLQVTACECQSYRRIVDPALDLRVPQSRLGGGKQPVGDSLPG